MRLKYNADKFFRLLLPVFFLGFVGIFSFITTIFTYVFHYYVVMSILLFIIYGKDKRDARNKKWRVSESTLNFISLLGGWPGALVAQTYFRHKTQKKMFLFVHWMAVVINCGCLIWLLSPNGSILLNQLLNSLY